MTGRSMLHNQQRNTQREILLEPGRKPLVGPLRRVYKESRKGWHSNYSTPSPRCLHGIDKGYCSFSVTGFQSISRAVFHDTSRPLFTGGAPPLFTGGTRASCNDASSKGQYRCSPDRWALEMGTKKLRAPKAQQVKWSTELPVTEPFDRNLFPHINVGSKRAYTKISDTHSMQVFATYQFEFFDSLCL